MACKHDDAEREFNIVYRNYCGTFYWRVAVLGRKEPSKEDIAQGLLQAEKSGASGFSYYSFTILK